MLGNKQIMAKNIKRHLADKGVTQTEMARELGFNAVTVSDWINAKTYPRIDKIERMAGYFGCQKADLVEDRENYHITDYMITDPIFQALVEVAAPASHAALQAAIAVIKAVDKK